MTLQVADAPLVEGAAGEGLVAGGVDPLLEAQPHQEELVPLRLGGEGFLLDDPVYAETYRGYLARTLEAEYEPAAAERRFREAHALIAPYVVGPEGEIEGHTHIESEASFNVALDALVAHAGARQQDVTAFLGQ